MTAEEDVPLLKTGHLPMSVRRLMTMPIVHCISVKLSTMFRRTFTTSRHRPVESLAIVEVMINMSVKMFRTVEPWARADEDTA